MVIGDRGYLEAELLWRHGGVAPTNEAMTRQRSASARRVVRALLPRVMGARQPRAMATRARCAA